MKFESCRAALRAGVLLCLVGLLGCEPAERVKFESTDLFLVTLLSEDGFLLLGNPRNITDRDGYDNQPAFAAGGGKILYSAHDGVQADIFRYEIGAVGVEQITDTGSSEYSPQPLPDGNGFSAVRLERGGWQRLWSFEDDGSQGPLLDSLDDPVMYYAWVDERTAAVCLIDSDGVFVLYLADLSTGKAQHVIDDVGRSIQLVPGRRAISFVHKPSPEDWWIKQLDLDSGETTVIARTVQGAEDHAWTPDGVLLMASGAELFIHTPDEEHAWELLADFSGGDVRDITRLAVSPRGDQIVFVSRRK